MARVTKREAQKARGFANANRGRGGFGHADRARFLEARAGAGKSSPRTSSTPKAQRGTTNSFASKTRSGTRTASASTPRSVRSGASRGASGKVSPKSGASRSVRGKASAKSGASRSTSGKLSARSGASRSTSGKRVTGAFPARPGKVSSNMRRPKSPWDSFWKNR